MRILLLTLLLLGASRLVAQSTNTNPPVVVPSVLIDTLDFGTNTTSIEITPCDLQAWQNFLLTGTDQQDGSVLGALVRLAKQKRLAYPHSIAAAWLRNIYSNLQTNGVMSATNPSVISVLTNLETQ